MLTLTFYIHENKIVLNQKACLINWVLLVSNSVFHYFLDSILLVPFNFNNQNKHLQLIDFVLNKVFFFFFEILHIKILVNKYYFW